MNSSSIEEIKQKRRIRKIYIFIIIIAITGIVLVYETYAWFVGISTVSVDQFDIAISGGEGLELSLDASTWTSTTLSVTKSTVEAATGNNNKWVSTTTGEGLVPISTIGEINTSQNVLKLYGKGSLAATGGGYRLISSQIENSSSTEQDGYIAFNLYIRNGKKDAYASGYDANADEAIYMSTASSVTVSPSGTGDPTNAKGLQNSVRVAFAQIGRVKYNSSASVAKGITCSTQSPVTGLCSSVGTVIWEPNDKAHDTNLITYYGNVCKARTGPNAYSGSCGTVANNAYVHTYAVKKAITASNNVNVYDGADFNTYTSSSTYLQEMDYFTDTEKNTSGNARPEFFKLAANSITKVRVYIYLEGQDVDNYDLVSKGKSIRVKFGFTKDKYNVNT